MDKLEKWQTSTNGDAVWINAQLWHTLSTISFGSLMSCTEVMFKNGVQVLLDISENDRIKEKLVELGVMDAEIEEPQKRDVLK